MRDLVHRVSIIQSTGTATVTTGATGTNGTGASILGYESVTGLMRVTALTNLPVIPKLQVSADNATYYDLDATGYIGGVAPGSQNAVGDYIFGILQLTSAAANAAGVSNTALIFARVVVTTGTAGGTPTVTFQTDLILAFPRHSGNAV